MLESIYCKLLDSILLESILLESIYIYMNMIGDLNKHGGVLIKRWGIQTTNDSCLMVELQ